MNDETHSEVQNALLLAGGIALVAFGAGLIVAHPGIRRTVMGALAPLLPETTGAANGGVGGLFPDVERYLKLRAM